MSEEISEKSLKVNSPEAKSSDEPTDEKKIAEELLPTKEQKDTLTAVPEPVERVMLGSRAVPTKFMDGFKEGASQVWGSRILIILVIAVVSSIYLGVSSVMFFMDNEVMVEVDADKVKVSLDQQKEDKPVQIPISKSGSFVAIIGHFILVILSIRCLILMFRKERNAIDYRMTQL